MQSTEQALWEARSRIVDMGKQLVEKRLVAGSWGNISCKVNDGAYAITPSGRAYGSLKPEDIVIIDPECRVLDGALLPSSESRLHTAIYAACGTAQAVIHTHSIYASALAAMRQPLPAIIEDIVQIIGGRVECAAYAPPGTQQLAEQAVAALHGSKAALLANHGAVCWGVSLDDALTVAEILEKAAQIALICRSCGGAVELPAAEIAAMHAFYDAHYVKRQLGEE